MDGGIRQSPLIGPTDTHHLAAVHSPAFECRPVCPVRRLSADQSAQSGERRVARPRSASSKDGRLSAILRGVRPQEAHAHSHLDVPCCLILSHSGVPMIAFRLGSGAIYGKRLFAYSPWLPPGGPSTTDRKGGDGVTFHRAMAGPTRNRQRQFWRRRSSARLPRMADRRELGDRSGQFLRLPPAPVAVLFVPGQPSNGQVQAPARSSLTRRPS